MQLVENDIIHFETSKFFGKNKDPVESADTEGHDVTTTTKVDFTDHKEKDIHLDSALTERDLVKSWKEVIRETSEVIMEDISSVWYDLRESLSQKEKLMTLSRVYFLFSLFFTPSQILWVIALTFSGFFMVHQFEKGIYDDINRKLLAIFYPRSKNDEQKDIKTVIDTLRSYLSSCSSNTKHLIMLSIPTLWIILSPWNNAITSVLLSILSCDVLGIITTDSHTSANNSTWTTGAYDWAEKKIFKMIAECILNYYSGKCPFLARLSANRHDDGNKEKKQ